MTCKFCSIVGLLYYSEGFILGSVAFDQKMDFFNQSQDNPKS